MCKTFEPYAIHSSLGIESFLNEILRPSFCHSEGMCKFCTHHFFFQFTFFENIIDMSIDNRSIPY